MRLYAKKFSDFIISVSYAEVSEFRDSNERLARVLLRLAQYRRRGEKFKLARRADKDENRMSP